MSYVPHFKRLINANLDSRSQGCDSTFTICHTLLKKTILEGKRAQCLTFVFPGCILTPWKQIVRSTKLAALLIGKN